MGVENCFFLVKFYFFKCCVELNLKICGIWFYLWINDVYVFYVIKFGGIGDIIFIGKILI